MVWLMIDEQRKSTAASFPPMSKCRQSDGSKRTNGVMLWATNDSITIHMTLEPKISHPTFDYDILDSFYNYILLDLYMNLITNN